MTVASAVSTPPLSSVWVTIAVAVVPPSSSMAQVNVDPSTRSTRSGQRTTAGTLAASATSWAICCSSEAVLSLGRLSEATSAVAATSATTSSPMMRANASAGCRGLAASARPAGGRVGAVGAGRVATAVPGAEDEGAEAACWPGVWVSSVQRSPSHQRRAADPAGSGYQPGCGSFTAAR